jgi:hypothetical protein
MRLVRALGPAMAATAALAACVPRTPPPAPTPTPAPLPRPVTPPPQSASPPAPPSVAWQYGPLSPGDWDFGPGPRPRAAFGAESPTFVVECMAGRQIALSRIGAAPAASMLTIRTDLGERGIAAAGQPGAITATLVPSDPLLDELAFSRGRFLIRVDGLPDLVLPAWPEPARVIEECRGQ